jgi:DNA-binding CsgD family transcriptional regulator
MRSPTEGQTRLVIVGATGMVGGYALRYALEDPSVAVVTVIGRRKLGISHPKLQEVVHNDFADCSALAKPLSDQDAAVFCLGVYTGAVPDAEFRKITVDYKVEFARVLRGSSPGAAFSFLSGMGADQTGRSRVPFTAVEQALQKDRIARQQALEQADLLARYRSLTPREQELLLRGLLNKQAAAELGITEYTVQIHRGNIMRKMKADSFATLVRLATKLIPDGAPAAGGNN